MAEITYDFYTKYAKISNSGQSRSVVLHGNIYDLFWNGVEYVPLVSFMLAKTKPANVIQIVYELNGPIRISEDDKVLLRDAWMRWKCGVAKDDLILRNLIDDVRKIEQGMKIPSEAEKVRKEFDNTLLNAINSPAMALEFMRQLCIVSRSTKLEKNLLIFIEGADMLLPAGSGDVATLNDGQLYRIAIAQDWFTDPAFVAGKDNVCMIAESRSLVHQRVSKMPVICGVEVPSPSLNERQHFIDTFLAQNKAENPWTGTTPLANITAGLSLYALRQLLAGAVYAKETLTNKDVVAKVEEYIKSQVGDDVVEFSKPEHTLADVVGCSKIKTFLKKELIPRLKMDGKNALTGCAVSGPIGGGKTFCFEAVASELDMPVLVIKNIRSQWFGQTDVIFERLRRALEALGKVCIFIDEADTQFGGVGAGTHETERRLTGKIQAMMSDPKLKGKVVWILMTARIHLLSPDIRRPGRAGDLIIPVLDPIGEDRLEFINWALTAYFGNKEGWKALAVKLESSIPGDYSAAAFAALRSHLAYHNAKEVADESNRDFVPADIDVRLNIHHQHLIGLIQDLIPSDIADARLYQTLQALLNTTRLSLLPTFEGKLETLRASWIKKIQALEEKGIR